MDGGNGVILRKSKEFPGIAFSFDPQTQPFFKAIVKENLRKLRLIRHGRAILEAIKNARPFYTGDFENGVNVLIKPPLERIWVSPGLTSGGRVTNQQAYDNFRNIQAGKLTPTRNSKTAAAELNVEASKNNTGSVCWLYFSNNEIMSASGDWLPPHMTMGHELIHCIHALYGEMRQNPHEEWATVGIKGFEDALYTENKLRADSGIILRTKYFSDD